MASTKVHSLPQPNWNTDPISINDFLTKNEVPCVARVVKGHIMNIGPPTLNPLKKVHHDILVHSIKSGSKIFGHSVMRIDGRDGRTTRLISLEQKLSIPVTYKGWFELLSENGRSIRPIESVSELAKLYPSVSRVLVKQNVQAYVLIEADRKLIFNKTKIVTAGDQLTITGEPAIQMPGKLPLLKCTDSNGEAVYLSFDQKCCFTPIANDGDVLGVFMIKDVISRFRLPLTVKLVQGVWPKVDKNRFTGLIRLDWVYSDETAFVCPLDRNIPRIYPISTEVKLRLVTATNNNELKETESFKNIMVKCNRLVSSYHNTIHLIVALPEGVVKVKSHIDANICSDLNAKVNENSEPATQMKRAKSKEDILMAELDDLYGYLRQGKQPPIGKYTRDSDEETYYEEPDFEPKTKFKHGLDFLNPSEVVSRQQNASYNFVDTRTKLGANYSRLSMIALSNTPPELPPRDYRHSMSSPQLFRTVISSTGSPVSSGISVSVQTPNESSNSGNSGILVRVSNSHITDARDQCSTGNICKISNDSRSSGSDDRKDSDYKGSRTSTNGSSNKIVCKSTMPILYL